MKAAWTYKVKTPILFTNFLLPKSSFPHCLFWNPKDIYIQIDEHRLREFAIMVAGVC
jgi:hypothetical protein